MRGVAGTHRGSRYGTVPNYMKRATSEICVIVQIETLAALDRLEAIAAVPGIDSIFVGPTDLAASMGHLGDIESRRGAGKSSRTPRKECRRLGKPCGIIGGTPEVVATYLDYGYSWVAIDSDMGMMVGRAQDFLAKVRAKVG